MRQRDERIDNAHHKAAGDVLYDKTTVHPVKLYRPAPDGHNIEVVCNEPEA